MLSPFGHYGAISTGAQTELLGDTLAERPRRRFPAVREFE
jgi:hypothetical protein